MKRETLSRRHFLGASAAASAWAATAGAIEPLRRAGGPHFKFSLAAYSYRSLLQGKQAELTLLDFIDDCAKMGLDGAELTSYYFPNEITAGYLRQLKAACFRNGLDVSGTAVRNDFGHPQGSPARDKWIAHVKQWVDYAERLGAPVIRIFAGHQQQGVSEERTHELIVEGIQQCCDYAGQHGVHLALENHGGPTATSEGLLKLVKAVDSPWFGVNLDTGNFHSDHAYEEIAAAAPYAINVQVKVVMSGADRKVKKPADYPRLARILRDAGYAGYVVLEYEESGDPRQQCPRHMQQLREAFASA